MVIKKLKNWINENMFRSDGALNPKRCKKKWFYKYGYEDIYEDIVESTPFLDDLNPSLSQRIYHILKGKFSLVVCGYDQCNKVPSFQSFSMGYLDYCSQVCAQCSQKVKDKSKKTIKSKYGVEHHLQKKEFLEKQKQTVKEKYGVENVS